jgi:multidrug resistance efflux pump
MRKRIVYGALSLAAGALAVAVMIHARAGSAPSPGTAAAAQPDIGNTICAAGKVEPVSEEIKIGSQLAGVLRDVPVEEGQHVVQGAVIATLDNGDYAARVNQAGATVALRQAELDRLVNGAREQERSEAAAAVEEAKAVLANARTEIDRRRSLFQTGDISRSDWERFEREYQVAEARVTETSQHFAFLDAPARADERAKAEAAVDLAKAQLAEAQALLEKTIVRAPFTGTVLRRYRKAGETVSDKGDTPIVSFGDNSRLRVRVDVDETDVAKLRVGDRVYFTAPAFGTERFWGRVARIGSELGQKNVDTGQPAEKLDAKILETLVDVDGHPPLPPGLRVDSFIQTGGK